MTAQTFAAKPAGSAYTNYAPLPGVPDEFVGPDGQARGAWRQFFDLLEADDSERSLAAAERHMRDIGVSYRVHGEARERPWPMSRLPLLIEESDWQAIVAGVTQRAAIMESLLADVYGPNKLVGEGVIPAAVVAGSQDYLRPLVGMNPPGGRWMHLYAADIGRGPDGRWWILGDRTQAPSGAGYALENRLVMARALPERLSRPECGAGGTVLPRLALLACRCRRAFAAAHLPADARSLQRDLFRAGLSRALSRLPSGRGRRSCGAQQSRACAHHRGPQARRRDLATRRFRFHRPARTERYVPPRRARYHFGDASRAYGGVECAGFGLRRIARADELHAAHRRISSGRRAADAEYRDLVVRRSRGARGGAGRFRHHGDFQRFQRHCAGLRDQPADSAGGLVGPGSGAAARGDRDARPRLCRSGGGAIVDHAGLACRRDRAASVRAAGLRGGDAGRLACHARRLLPDFRASRCARHQHGRGRAIGRRLGAVVEAGRPRDTAAGDRRRADPPHSRQSAEPSGRQPVLVWPLPGARGSHSFVSSDACARAAWKWICPAT